MSEQRSSEGVKLIGLIDTYGEVVAKSLNKDENKTISKPNMGKSMFRDLLCTIRNRNC